MFLGKCRLLSYFMMAGIVSSGSKPVDEQKIQLIAREFRLALKVLLSNVRTDTESGGKADARQGT